MIFDKRFFATVMVANAIQTTVADSIYNMAKSSDDFSTIAAAIDASAVGPAGPNLVDALSGEGTFTIFGPTNAAFDKLPTELVTKLLNPTWQPQLQDVLLYHALADEFRSTDVAEGLTSPTLNGEDIVVNLNPPRINNSSNILVDAGLVDIEADNGVIHGIDSVLTPISVTSNIVDLAVGGEDFSTLVAAVTAAGLADALSGEGPLTVFAPTNAAFAALPEGTLDSLLLPENVDQLKDILLYHVVEANAHSSGLTSGDVETLNGDSVNVAVSDAGVTVNGASVVAADIIASNGIIHVIDSVLLPAAGDVDATTTTEATKAAADITVTTGATEAPPEATDAPPAEIDSVSDEPNDASTFTINAMVSLAFSSMAIIFF